MKKMKLTKRKVVDILLGLIPPVLIFAFWYYETNYNNIPPAILPKISSVWQTFCVTLANGQLGTDLAISLSCVLRGFLVASVVGVVLGSVMGMSHKIRAILQPTVTCFRQIPMIAWMPLIILWCGIGDKAKVVLIVIAAFFPILVNTENGIETTPDSYLEVARLYKLTPVKMFTRVYLPHALPSILVGLKLGLSVSWMAVVGAELIASTSGIGYRMSNARSLMQSGVLILCMIVVGAIGILMDKIIGSIFRSLTPWIKR